MSRMSMVLTICLLFDAVYYSTGNLNCKQEPCSCCRSGMCADPHLSVLPCNGCIDGYSGPSCYEPCPTSCVNCSQLFYEYETERVCHQCKTGFYKGRYKDISSYPLQLDCSLPCVENCEMCTSYYNCMKCKQGYYLAYGKDCLRCAENCDQCRSGSDCQVCEDGYIWNGEVCAACDEGYFGKNCLEKCPDNCKNNLCHKSTGVCVFCNDSYYFNHEQKCVKCSEHCSNCLSNDSCLSCTAGYMGDTCNIKCSNCGLDAACDKSTGYCFSGCKEGYSGDDCSIPCDPKCFVCDRKTQDRCISCAIAKYGKTCEYHCSKNCINSTCSYTDGTCKLGCHSGYWGDKCEHNCSTDCVDQKCERSNGTCVKRCADNLERNTCICPINCECDTHNHCVRCLRSYGDLCEIPCSKGCIEGVCDRTTGECLKGCLPGFAGSRCFAGQEIEESRISTTVLVTVVSLLVVVVAVLLVIFLVRKRKQRDQVLPGVSMLCINRLSLKRKKKKETSFEATDRETYKSQSTSCEDTDDKFIDVILCKSQGNGKDFQATACTIGEPFMFCKS